MTPMVSNSASSCGNLIRGASRPGTSWSRKRPGLPGDHGFLPFPVEGVDLFLGLGGRKDQFVAAEEFHERGSVLAHLLPALLGLLRVAEDQRGLSAGQFERGLGHLRGVGLSVSRYRI